MKNQLTNLQTEKKYDLEEIIDLVKKLPNSSFNKRLIEQVVGSGGSLGANYCEANEAKVNLILFIRSASVKKKLKKLNIG